MEQKQNQLVKLTKKGLLGPDFRLPQRFFLGWAFFLLGVVGIFGALLLWARLAQAQVIVPNPCQVNVNCQVKVSFQTQDPEQDRLQVTFSTTVPNPFTYTITSCSLGSDPPIAGQTTTPLQPATSCITPQTPPGPGVYTAIGNYTFKVAGTYYATYQICDDSGHCTSGTTPKIDVLNFSFTFTPGPSTTWSSTAISITLGFSPTVTQARYRWDFPADGSNGTIYTDGTQINSPAGDHTLWVWGTNGKGLTATDSRSPYRYDNANPSVVTFTSLSPNPNNTGTHTVNWTDSTDTQSGIAGYYVYQSSGGSYIYQALTVYDPLDPSASSQWTSSNLDAGIYT